MLNPSSESFICCSVIGCTEALYPETVFISVSEAAVVGWLQSWGSLPVSGPGSLVSHAEGARLRSLSIHCNEMGF